MSISMVKAKILLLHSTGGSYLKLYPLKDLLPKPEAELVTLKPQYLGELWRPAVEYGDLPFVLFLQLLEHFVPVGTPGVCPGLEARY